MQIPYTRWGGAAVAGALGDYADIRLNSYSQTLTNSEILAIVLAGLEAFNVAAGNRWRPALDGGADWGIGALAAGIARRRLMPPATTTTPVTPPATTTTTVTPASHAVTSHTTLSGRAGVPASGGSAAFDLPTG